MDLADAQWVMRESLLPCSCHVRLQFACWVGQCLGLQAHTSIFWLEVEGHALWDALRVGEVASHQNGRDVEQRERREQPPATFALWSLFRFSCPALQLLVCRSSLRRSLHRTGCVPPPASSTHRCLASRILYLAPMARLQICESRWARLSSGNSCSGLSFEVYSRKTEAQANWQRTGETSAVVALTRRLSTQDGQAVLSIA